MNRILWGLVKIALLVGVLVLGARLLMSDQFTAMVETQLDQVVEEDNSEEYDSWNMEDEEVETEAEAEVFTRSAEPVTVMQKRYVGYSIGAGAPEAFEASFVLKGRELVSSQIARMVGESSGNWSNLATHKKTFFVLSEMALLGLNVDSPATLNGAMIKIQNGVVSVNMSNVEVLEVVSYTPTKKANEVKTAAMETVEQVEVTETIKKETRGRIRPAARSLSGRRSRMTVVDWEAVVEKGEK